MADLDYQYIGKLVVRARGGDSDAFAELYAATYKKQYLFACGYLKDDDMAQDALQETYLLAYRKLPTLKDPELFISWLNQINFRICYDMNNKQKQYRLMNTNIEEGADVVDTGYGQPEREMIIVDNSRYLIEQIMALPFSESQAIYLYYYNNMKINDIAYIMDVSRSSVKRYIKSGCAHLAEALK